MATEPLDRRTISDAFRLSPDLLAVATPEGVLKVVNEAWSRALGYSTEQLVGHHLSNLLDDADRTQGLRLVNPRLIGKDDAPFELALRCKDRSYRLFVWERRRIAAEENLFLVGKDITRRKTLEVTNSLRLFDLRAQASKQKPTSL